MLLPGSAERRLIAVVGWLGTAISHRVFATVSHKESGEVVDFPTIAGRRRETIHLVTCRLTDLSLNACYLGDPGPPFQFGARWN